MEVNIKTFLKIMLYTAAIVLGIMLFWAMMLLCIYFFTPTDTLPYINEYSQDPYYYRQINENFEAILESNNEIDFLPMKIQVQENTKYIYSFISDDPKLSYLLYLEQPYAEEEKFIKEIDRLKSFSDREIIPCGKIEYIIFKFPDEERIDVFISSKVTVTTDGISSKYYLSRIDPTQKQITYLLCWDDEDVRKNELVVDFLKLYLEEVKNCA